MANVRWISRKPDCRISKSSSPGTQSSRPTFLHIHLRVATSLHNFACSSSSASIVGKYVPPIVIPLLYSSYSSRISFSRVSSLESLLTRHSAAYPKMNNEANIQICLGETPILRNILLAIIPCKNYLDSTVSFFLV